MFRIEAFHFGKFRHVNGQHSICIRLKRLTVYRASSIGIRRLRLTTKQIDLYFILIRIIEFHIQGRITKIYCRSGHTPVFARTILISQCKYRRLRARRHIADPEFTTFCTGFRPLALFSRKSAPLYGGLSNPIRRAMRPCRTKFIIPCGTFIKRFVNDRTRASRIITIIVVMRLTGISLIEPSRESNPRQHFRILFNNSTSIGGLERALYGRRSFPAFCVIIIATPTNAIEFHIRRAQAISNRLMIYFIPQSFNATQMLIVQYK